MFKLKIKCQAVKKQTVECPLSHKTLSKYHFVSFVLHISGAKFEEHYSNISRDILDSAVYYSTGSIHVITFPH